MTNDYVPEKRRYRYLRKQYTRLAHINSQVGDMISVRSFIKIGLLIKTFSCHVEFKIDGSIASIIFVIFDLIKQ